MSYQYEDSPSLIVKTFSFWEELGGFAMVDFLRGFHFFFLLQIFLSSFKTKVDHCVGSLFCDFRLSLKMAHTS